MNRDSQAATVLAPGDRGWARRALPFAGGMLVAVVSLLLPGIRTSDPTEVIVAGLLAAAAIAGAAALPWPRLPEVATAAPSLAFLAATALLRDAQGGSRSVFAVLVVVPVLWAALHASGRVLAGVVAAASGAFLLPLLVVGAPSYPESDVSRVLLWPVVSAIVGYAVHRLVADQRSDAAALDRLQRRQAQILAGVSAGVVEVAPDGRIVYANATAEALAGHHPGGLAGRPHGILFGAGHGAADSDGGAGGGCPVDAVIADGVARESEEGRFVRADGSGFAVRWRIAPVEEGGAVTSAIVTFEDVTARRAADERLAAATARLEAEHELSQAVLDSIDVGVVACDADGRLTLFNRATRAMHGVEPDDHSPMADWADRYDLFGPDGTTRLPTEDIPLVRALRDGSVKGAEIVISPHGRPPVRAVTNGRRLTTAGGTPLGAMVAMHDVTAERDALDAVRAARDRFAGVLDAATEQAIVGTDADGVVTVFNRGAERLLGYPAGEVIGAVTPLAWHDPAEVAARAAELGIAPSHEVLVVSPRAGAPDTREWTYVARDGARVLVSLTVTAMRDQDGPLRGFIGVATDITERRATERLKDEFVGLVSHELRTPLTAIVGYVEMLQDDAGGLTEEQARFLATVDRNARRLLRLVGDLLIGAQVDAGRLALELSDVRLGEIASAAAEGARPRADAAGVSVRVHEGGAPEVRADAGRLGQVVDNLLTNAVKFTPRGGTVDVTLSAGDGTARIEVADTGIGIPDEELPKLFRRFFRASTATDRAIPGIGLGLAIVKTIVEAHHGTISVASSAGGTTFSIELPAPQAQATATAAATG